MFAAVHGLRRRLDRRPAAVRLRTRAAILIDVTIVRCTPRAERHEALRTLELVAAHELSPASSA
jgi:hypothetical protein